MTSLVVGLQAPAHVGDDVLEQRPALRVPEDRAGAFLLKMEEVHLAAQAAVIAPLGFLQPVQIGVELLLRRPGRAVDARQHRLRRVAAPIGARDLHQLEGRADLADGRQVRTATEIEPLALPIDAQGLIGLDRVDEFALENLALG